MEMLIAYRSLGIPNIYLLEKRKVGGIVFHLDDSSDVFGNFVN